jgi:hypothetical protein
MKKTQFKIIFIFILIFILNLFLTNKIFAATLTLVPSKTSVGIGEQFYVDLMLDTNGQSINTINGSISFPDDKVSFVREEDGKSMVNLWVEKPKLENNTISFAGAISNGFEGVIDPFNPSHMLPGLIIRLVFEPKTSGDVNFSTSTFSLNLNDGLGTEIEAPSATGTINVGNYDNKVKYVSKEEGSPELEAYIVRDPNIYNNKYTLIFNATDKDTGIKSIKIKEGMRDWKEIQSPYLLRDQSRHSTITLEATSYSGSGIIMSIDKVPYDYKSLAVNSFIIVLILILIILIVKKIYVKKK